jgi:hypothetical protein
VRRFNILYGDISRLARSTDMDQVLETFESDLRHFVARTARRKVFVHAGVVGWRGRAILIPGHSMSGKTSLVEQGRVHPFPKTLSIRERGLHKQTEYAVETFGALTGVKPLPVGLVVVSSYKAGARWRPQTVSAGQAILELLAHTISARQQPEKALTVLQRAIGSASVLKGVRGEAHEVAGAVLKQG